MNQDQIIVRKHKGRSGKSIFEWRVYREGRFYAKQFRHQLGKYKTHGEAEQAAKHYRQAAIAKAENRS